MARRIGNGKGGEEIGIESECCIVMAACLGTNLYLSAGCASVLSPCKSNASFVPQQACAAAPALPIQGRSRRDGMQGSVLQCTSSAERTAVAAEAGGWRSGGREEELYGDYEQVDYAQIDAFTDRAFSGNPAAVVVLPEDRDDKWLQLMAREFNLSETAYLVRRTNTPYGTKQKKGRGLVQVNESGTSLKASKSYAPLREENEFNLRWFTPAAEVDLCGHATLASAHLLFSSGIVEGDTAIFHTRSGVLKASKVSGYREYKEDPDEEEKEEEAEKRKPSDKGVVQLDFPLVPATACDDNDLLSQALGGVEVMWVGMSTGGDYLVEVQSSEDLESINPNFDKLLNLNGRGVIVTASAAGSSEYDFISRFFGPKVGIKEDPATGSAHCTLGPYWASKLGKTELNAYQASQRGGKFLVRVDEEAGRCYLQGGSVLVMAGVAGIR